MSSLTIRLLNKSSLNDGSAERGRSIKPSNLLDRVRKTPSNERHPQTATDEIPIAPRWRV
jgi:hypothetical protein